MTNEEGYLWTRESIFEKYPIALKLTHVIFGQKSYWFRWGLRDTFGFAQAWTARHFWTVEDLKTYWLLRADILWILRLQGRKRAEIRYSFSFFKTFSPVQYAPFYLQNERTGVPVLFVYCSCDYDPYFDRNRCEVLPEVQGLQVHSISGSWWDWWHLVRKLEVNLKAVNITLVPEKLLLYYYCIKTSIK